MIELAEHSGETRSAPTIPLEMQEQMSRALGNRLNVTWLSGGRVNVRSSSWVGSVRLTPELHVRVVPKLADGSLGVLTMLAITDGSPLAELPQYLRGLGDDPDEDAVQLLCRLVVTHTEKVVSRGLIRNYRGHADDLPFLRGRLDAYRQATVYFGKFTEFACEYNEFDRDTAENHLLLGGVKAARLTTRSASVRRRAADLERRLADVAPTLPNRRKLLSTKIVYGRRNAHYQVAHTWCRSLLKLARIDDADSATQLDAFLINMNALFEQFVEWLIRRAYAGMGVDIQAQQRNPSLITVDGQHRRTIAPDLVVAMHGCSLAIDAKYKRYDARDISPSDIYQLLLYAQCYTQFEEIPTSYLVYPSARMRAPTLIELKVPTEGGTRQVRVRALGIALAEIVEGLRTGNEAPLIRTIDEVRNLLPVTVSRLHPGVAN